MLVCRVSNFIVTASVQVTMSESDDLKREGRLLVEPTPTADIDDYSCIFCYTGLESEEVFGSVYTFDELKVHYNCLVSGRKWVCS